MNGRGRNGDEPYDADTFGTYSVATLCKRGSFCQVDISRSKSKMAEIRYLL